MNSIGFCTGHDGFLLEQGKIGPMVQQFLDAQTGRNKLGDLEDELAELRRTVEELKAKL